MEEANEDWTDSDYNDWVAKASREELIEEAYEHNILTYRRKVEGLRKELYR